MTSNSTYSNAEIALLNELFNAIEEATDLALEGKGEQEILEHLNKRKQYLQGKEPSHREIR